MSIDILMPALSPTMTEGNLAKWHKKEGDNVSSGDVIAEIETDKATMEVEAVDEGVLGKIVVSEGSENVQVNAVIGVLLEDGEDPGDIKASDRSAVAYPDAAEAGQEAPAPEATTDATGAVTPTPKPVVAEKEFTGSAVKLTVREALRDAMAEEMRSDEAVFLMGEEVAQFRGSYKVTEGLLERFGEKLSLIHI